MSKREQVLILEPSHELKFKGPFTDVVTSYLQLNNPSDRRVCFKVKTTAPKRYCVRPNNGIVEPKGFLSVAVMLQPFEYDPNDKNKHKFMVQTMFVPEGDICQESLWKDVLPENLMDSKLRCVFEPAVNGTPQNNTDGSTLPLTEEKTMSIAKTPEPISKLSPKGGVCGNLENDLKRTHEEMRRLEVENSDLRHENVKLKEEGLRLRRQQQRQPLSGASTSSTEEYKTSSSAALLQPFPMTGCTPQQQQQQQIVLVMVAVVAFIVGLIVGKVF